VSTSVSTDAPSTRPRAGDLEVHDLWKRYARAEPVLRGVSVTVPSGSLVAVLGLSGCGKTTLLRAIAGFERFERGRIGLGAQTLDDGRVYVRPERRGIGYVPQEGALFPNLDVRGNLAFGLSRAERRTSVVDGLLELVGLTGLAKRYPHELSGGEQQRVALARALAREPDVLLLDEPFSSLDASLRTTVREEVGALLRHQGVTTVLVTHDQEEALSLADSVAVLRDGVVVQQGTPRELYRSPVDGGLASFLGVANLLEATLEGDWAQTVVGRLQLRSGDPSTGSASAVVVLRPEDLLISANGQPQDGLRGVVEGCTYYGHDALLHIRDPQRPDAELLVARVAGEHALEAGTTVIVTARGPVSTVGATG
jgi:iron(III) transport system ATP-binding protein